MTKLKVMISDTFDPWFNLATEDWIFRDMDPSYHILFLWRNQNTVVIGRCQNPWVECDVKKMEEDGIKLARRQSGGGAVFHDLGNTNFTFLSGKEGYSKDNNFEIILKALQRFQIPGEKSGRNDLLVSEKKVSGSAFKETQNRCFHHGTLLIDADMSKLANYLKPRKKKLEAKGLKSVRMRVSNLVEFNPEINHDNVCQAIIEEFFQFYNAECPIEKLDHDHLTNIPKLREYYETLKDWDWRFGETPQFTHHLEEKLAWGHIDVHIDCKKSHIVDVKVFSDTLIMELVDLLQNYLLEVRYDRHELSNALNQLMTDHPFYKEQVKEFRDWFVDEVR